MVYTVKNFIERNADELSSSLEQCMLSKADNIISSLFSGKFSKEGINNSSGDMIADKKGAAGANKGKTIWAKFSLQMLDLMIELAEPLFDLNKDALGAEESKESP